MMNVFNLLAPLATTLPNPLELKLKTQLKIRCGPAQPQLVNLLAMGSIKPYFKLIIMDDYFTGLV